jgi:hypothetical protein
MASVSVAIKSFEASKFSLDDGIYAIERIDLNGGRITLQSARPIALSVDAEADDISNATGKSFRLTIQTAIEEPESDGQLPRAALTGDVTLVPLGFDGRIETSRLPLPTLVGAADVGPIATWLHSGTASGVLALGFETAAEEDRNIRVGGKITIDDFHFANSLDENIRETQVAWESLTFDLRETVIPLASDG